MEYERRTVSQTNTVLKAKRVAAKRVPIAYNYDNMIRYTTRRKLSKANEFFAIIARAHAHTPETYFRHFTSVTSSA